MNYLVATLDFKAISKPFAEMYCRDIFSRLRFTASSGLLARIFISALCACGHRRIFEILRKKFL